MSRTHPRRPKGHRQGCRCVVCGRRKNPRDVTEHKPLAVTRAFYPGTALSVAHAAYRGAADVLTSPGRKKPAALRAAARTVLEAYAQGMTPTKQEMLIAMSILFPEAAVAGTALATAVQSAPATVPRANPRGSVVQTLLFNKDVFTKVEAKAWAKRHGFRYGDVRAEGGHYRLRQTAPRAGARYRTISFKPGVQAVVMWKR